MRPAIGDFHIFPALRLAVMPSPYITEITPEMQQKIKIFAEKGVPGTKKPKAHKPSSSKCQSPLPPARGWHTGRRPPAVPAGKRTSGSLRRLRRRACGPPRPNAQACPTGGKDSVKENRQGCLSRLIRAGAFKSAKRYALPPAPKKNAPGPKRTSLPHRRER